MLVLTRKLSQAIQLGADITITVVRTSQGSVKLGIQAPPELSISRPEIRDRRQEPAVNGTPRCR